MIKHDIFDICRYGRRPVLFAMMAIQTVTILIQMFSPSWEIFTAIFFFVGFSGFSNYVVAYVLGKIINFLPIINQKSPVSHE